MQRFTLFFAGRARSLGSSLALVAMASGCGIADGYEEDEDGFEVIASCALRLNTGGAVSLSIDEDWIDCGSFLNEFNVEYYLEEEESLDEHATRVSLSIDGLVEGQTDVTLPIEFRYTERGRAGDWVGTCSTHLDVLRLVDTYDSTREYTIGGHVVCANPIEQTLPSEEPMVVHEMVFRGPAIWQ